MRIDAIILRELHMPLVRPFETSFGVTRNRRILLAEVQSEGLTGWGECTAGEHPYFSAESTDSAWAVITQELGPMLAAEPPEHGGECPRIFRQVRGNRMAKAALENAIWDLEAQREGISLSKLLGGVQETIPCGVSLGIQASIPELLGMIEKELAAGYQRIKLKVKPGWDVEVLERVRHRWPGIMLSCDANSAYKLRDADHLVEFDAFDLLMIEQPLWDDDFTTTRCCRSGWRRRFAWTNRFATGEMRWRRSRWSRARLSTSSWDAWADSPRRLRCIMRRRSGEFRCGAAGCWSRALDARTILRFRRWRTSRCRAMFRLRRGTGPRTLLSRR